MEAIGIACFVYVFIEVADIPYRVKSFLKNRGITKRMIRLRPFDCEGCLGFWLGITYFYTGLQLTECIQTILLASITSLLSILIFHILRKLE